MTPEESSIYLPLIKIGVNLGFSLATLISSFLSWQVTFYVVAFIGLAWSALWLFLISSDPKDHKLLSTDELLYIQQSRSNTKRPIEAKIDQDPTSIKAEKDEKQSKKNNSAPWLRILTNPSVLVFVVVKFTVKMSTDSQTTQVPRYFRQVMIEGGKMTQEEVSKTFVLPAICLSIV